jgi:flagellar basal body rod protein FlgG
VKDATYTSSMSSVLAIAQSGMNAAQIQLQGSAQNIANLNTAGYRRVSVQQATAADQGVSSSLSQGASPGNPIESDMVGLLQAKNSYLSNLTVFRSSDRMMGTLLDVTN